MARPKKAKHRHEPESIAETLDEIESRGDRLTEWIIENPKPILAAIGGVLIAAAAWGGVQTLGEADREAGSAALGRVQADYRRAMGATPEDVLIAEPANPEVARRVREEYVGHFAEVVESHGGTAAAAYAALEQGILQQELGQPDAAMESWQTAAAQVDAGSTMAALVQLRIASAHEGAGRWEEAARAYGLAADVQAFPLRQTARADAARCWAEAGDVDAALAAFEQIGREDPDARARLPEHVEARLMELQAAKRL